MFYSVYAVKDEVIGFNAPALQVNDAAAMRSFAEVFKDVHSPTDYSLWCLGSFDTDTGYIDSFDMPKLVCRATDFAITDYKESEKI